MQTDARTFLDCNFTHVLGHPFRNAKFLDELILDIIDDLITKGFGLFREGFLNEESA